MERSLKHIVFVFVCILSLTGCEGLYPPAEKDRQMVMCYIACHDNQLSDASRAAIDDIIANGELPPTDDDSKVLLIYYHLADSVPVLSRFSRDESGKCIEDKLVQYPGNSVISVLSLNPTQIRQVWTDAQALYPSNRQSLMISTHGSGYLPAGYLSNPEDHLDRNEQDPFRHLVKSGDNTRSVGPDDNTEIEVPALVSALEGTHFDFILFDCCLMAGVEVAYQMRNMCDYIIASPTEIMSKGVICGDLIAPSFSTETEQAARSICEVYMRHVRNDAGFYSSGCISAVKTSELEDLANICNDIYYRRRDTIPTINPASVQPYFRNRQHWFYDFGDFVRQICRNGDGTEDEAYGLFRSAMNRAVIFKDTTPYFLDVTINRYSGLSTYIPRATCPTLNSYYKSLDWNRATGFIR